MSKRIPSKAWKPGQSGNPDGRARVKLITDMMRKIANEEVAAKDEFGNTRNIKRLRKSTEALFEEAEKGNVTAFTVIAERLEGKVPNVNVEVPFKPAEDMSYEELLTFIVEGDDEGATDSDSALSRATPAGNA